jgi:hypothetical protein
MRIIAAALVTLTALSLHAAPISKKATPASLGLAPTLEPVTRGCSLGWHRGYWQDPSGERHWAAAFRTGADYSTVTDFARLRGLSISQPRFKATW